jgi:hypothetical protein
MPTTADGGAADSRPDPERLLERFEAAWLRGEQPDLDAHLPAQGRAAVLYELVHIDLECRLKRGLPARVEDYLARYPELKENRQGVLDLIAWEHEQRLRREPALAWSEYLARFPEYRADLLAGPLTSHTEPAPPGCPAPPPAPRVPGYEVLEPLGKGGMGVVHKARHLSLGRVVALKMMRSGEVDPEEAARFRTEARAVARLQHPNIVQIFEVGEHEARPFLAMEFCPGGNLDKKLNGAPLPPVEAARLLEALARAVQAAHRERVIHRDLKPANVLLAEDGTPKLADFGLAKKLDEQGQTLSGAILGTASYMAPEQAAGKNREVGVAADVYALGAVLYETLTGQPPFKAPTLFETLEQVRDRPPVPPRRLRSDVPHDLEAICLQCLQKDPARRYASAADLADDLRRFLDGKPLRASAARRPLRRRALLLGLGGFALLGLFLLKWLLLGPAPGAGGSEEGPGDTPANGDPPVRRARPNMHAVLIAVGKYATPKLRSPQYAENDIEALADVLRGPGAFATVRVLTTARGKARPGDLPTRANIRAALREVLNGRTEKDTILLALSGGTLGARGKAPRGNAPAEVFFCPRDGRPDDPGTLLKVGELFDELKGVKAAKLLLVDSPLDSPRAPRSLDFALPPPFAVLFSGTPGQGAYASSRLGKGHGIFFSSIVRGLRGAAKVEGSVEWDYLVAYVKGQVPREARRLNAGRGPHQTPHLLAKLGPLPPLVP